MNGSPGGPRPAQSAAPPARTSAPAGPLVLGIDLGLTHARCAYLGRNGPVLVRNDRGETATPTLVGLDRQGQLRIGELARAQLPFAPERTVSGVKRLIGTQNTVVLAERRYSPTEITGVLLRRLREDAERAVGARVSAAAIAVPAYFTEAQRQATRDAAALAALGSVALCSEPMAIALAYDLWDLPRGQRALVFDLGGAALDVSIIEGGERGPRLIAAAGQARLGGDELDRRLLNYLLELFERTYGFSLAEDAHSLARLRVAAERAKRDLCERETVALSVPSLGVPGGTPLTLETELSREQFELLVEDALLKTFEQVDIALRDARLSAAELDAVLLSGGGAQVPLLRRLLGERLGKAPREGVPPAEAIARGVALYAARLGLGQSAAGAVSGREALEGRSPESAELAEPPMPPVPKDAPRRSYLQGAGEAPTRAESGPGGYAARGLAALDEAEGFNGLAVASRERRQQEAQESTARAEPVTCPTTLGIEVVGQSGGRRMGGVFSPLLRRGELAPTAKTVIFHTTVDNQHEMDVRIYEGEGRLVRDNDALGVLTVRGIPPGPAGSEKLAVTFLCDERGALSVRARVLSTGQEETLYLPRRERPPALSALPDRARRTSGQAMPPGQLHPDDRSWRQEPPEPERSSRRGRSGELGDGRAPGVPVEVPRVFREDSGPEMDPVALRALLLNAERRASGAHPQTRAKLLYLARRLREAVVVGDRADVARLSEALENALLALD